MITTGQKIRLRRRERGVTQKELSELCGVAQSNLSNIEKDRADVTVSTLKRLAVALGVQPSALLDDELSQASAIRFLTRSKIEKIAKAVHESENTLSHDEAKMVQLFKNLLPQKTKDYVSLNKLHDSWLGLREILSKNDIENIYRRIQDAQMRNR